MKLKKYHLVTFHPTENGYDDAEDVNTMEEATKLAKEHLSDPAFCETVFVFNEWKNTLQRVFDASFVRGRKPFEHEKEQFCY